MGGAVLASVLRIAGRPSPLHHCRLIVLVAISLSSSDRRRPIVVVVLINVNVDVIVIIVVVVITTIVFHYPIVAAAIATILVVGVVVIAVAVVIDIVAPRRRACRAQWLSIQGTQPKQARAVSPMAWGWSASPWIFRKVANGFARTTSCQRCCLVGNIMVLSTGGWRKGTLWYSVFIPL